ncbi:MAG TPA: RpiB/LacA/LacB family sugar-phosphate isomerase [Candidatus Saccharimonadales bacterium]|nr:RpiB/LacA/LacB family sugar-phosphate isomerase [Candidatus Saccharimonadales bacterium]
MKVYVGADHNGFELKGQLIGYLKKLGYSVVDKGNKKLKSDDDFPDYALEVVDALLTSSDADPKGILICASGQGMCMVANRFKGIRASLIRDVEEARMGRNDDDSNVLCLASRMLSADQAESVVRTWLTTPFSGASRFQRRIREIDNFGS